MTTEKKQMFTRRITQANKTQLTVIVYEMLSAYLEDARAAHDAGQTEEHVSGSCAAALTSSMNWRATCSHCTVMQTESWHGICSA